MKKVLSILLTLTLVLSVMTAMTVSVSAASWPSLSKSAYCEFTATNQINVYRNTNLSTRGTSSPAKSYNAYIARNDVCKIYKITSSYVHLAYPTSSGYKEGFVRRSDLFSVSSPSDCVTSRGKATTYKKPGSGSYGYVASGDKVYKVGTSGNYTLIIYEAKSGSRAFKLGYVSASNYNNVICKTGDNKNNTTTVATSASFQYPMSNAYVCGNDWRTYYSKRPSRPYHVGIDIASRNSDSSVYAAGNGTVASTGYNSSNGNYVIIKHTISGKTVYSFYAHLKANSIRVSKGNYVNKGTKIATYGNTGSGSAGTHLHFAFVNKLWSNGSYYGYVTHFSGNTASYNGVTYYNPHYIINYNKLP